MADDRRREVEVGAGLQESRLNEEFIDALKKHGPKVIYALAAVVLEGDRLFLPGDQLFVEHVQHFQE